MALHTIAYGTCSCCGKDGRLYRKSRPALCFYCKAKQKKPKQKSKPVRNLRKKPTGESDMFREIWDERPRVSFVTGKNLPTIEAYAWYFSHVLPKGKYPELRLVKKNVVFMTLEEHELWENHQYKLKDDPAWDHVFKLKEELLNDYERIRTGSSWDIVSD